MNQFHVRVSDKISHFTPGLSVHKYIYKNILKLTYKKVFLTVSNIKTIKSLVQFSIQVKKYQNDEIIPQKIHIYIYNTIHIFYTFYVHMYTIYVYII